MRWSILNKLSVRPALKCAAEANAAAFGLDAAGSLMNLITTSILNRTNTDLMEELMRRQQVWQEDMYNKYQSPKALMRQYKDAGLNPYLQMLGQSVGSIPSGSSPSAPLGSGSSSNLAQGAAALEQVDAMRDYYSSASQNQRSQAVMGLIQSVNEAIIKQGPKVGREMLSKVLPQFVALGYEENYTNQLFAPQLMEAQANANLKKIESDWMSEHANKVFAERLVNLQAQTNEAYSRMEVQASEVLKNQALTKQYYQDIKESFSRIARNYAEALELKQVGDKYEADTMTADQIRQAVVNQAYLTNVGLALSNESNRVDLGIKEAGAAIKRKQASDPVLQGVKFGLETIGNVIHVNGGFNWSNLRVPAIGK